MSAQQPAPPQTPILVLETGGQKRRCGPLRAIDLSDGDAAAVSASRQAAGGAVVTLGGWSMVESTGAAAAEVRLFDGSGVGGGLLGIISLVAGASDTETFPGHGLTVETGKVYLDIVSGSVVGVLYVRLEDGEW